MIAQDTARLPSAANSLRPGSVNSAVVSLKSIILIQMFLIALQMRNGHPPHPLMVATGAYSLFLIFCLCWGGKNTLALVRSLLFFGILFAWIALAVSVRLAILGLSHIVLPWAVSQAVLVSLAYFSLGTATSKTYFELRRRNKKIEPERSLASTEEGLPTALTVQDVFEYFASGKTTFSNVQVLHCCTDGTIIALQSANDLAAAFRHESLGDAHLLAGILKDSAEAADVFRAACIDPSQIRIEAEKRIQGRIETSQNDCFKMAIASMIQLFQQHRHTRIGIEHLLFGLLASEGGLLENILTDLGLRRHRLDQVLQDRLARLPVEKFARLEDPKSLCNGPRKCTSQLPQTMWGRIAFGLAAILPLVFGLLGCYVCYVDRNFARAHRTVFDHTIYFFLVDASMLMTLASASAILWAIAKPKWIEKLYAVFIRKMMWLFIFLLIPISIIVMAGIMCVRVAR